MKFALEIEDVIDPREYAGRRDAVPAITERYTQALERWSAGTRSSTSGCTGGGSTSRRRGRAA